ncbi:hypothetical protein [Hymenobacter cellulosivorans]|uniref:Uncharacterized protein n=1 Tax=Hymenobacter cellulosivorans TaxID=2932249 RepID=A0ABY4F708_9BACT|nr:hypothetical protein [Hymenobacter cellulosivorans]UOQ52234.1 hypothetical protein MUN80_21035 [Hymenobacter cellulosivorans]
MKRFVYKSPNPARTPTPKRKKYPGHLRGALPGALCTVPWQRLPAPIAHFCAQPGLKNTRGVGSDFFSVVDWPERPVHLVTYDARSGTTDSRGLG